MRNAIVPTRMSYRTRRESDEHGHTRGNLYQDKYLVPGTSTLSCSTRLVPFRHTLYKLHQFPINITKRFHKIWRPKVNSTHSTLPLKKETKSTSTSLVGKSRNKFDHGQEEWIFLHFVDGCTASLSMWRTKWCFRFCRRDYRPNRQITLAIASTIIIIIHNNYFNDGCCWCWCCYCWRTGRV